VPIDWLNDKLVPEPNNWLENAVSFVVLGLTGLNITFGKILLLPVIGPDAFSSVSQAAKYVHNFTSFSFVVGLVLITVIFFQGQSSGKGGHRLA
jgi:formate dehydrogenase subunit gamma